MPDLTAAGVTPDIIRMFFHNSLFTDCENQPQPFVLIAEHKKQMPVFQKEDTGTCNVIMAVYAVAMTPKSAFREAPPTRPPSMSG